MTTSSPILHETKNIFQIKPLHYLVESSDLSTIDGHWQTQVKMKLMFFKKINLNLLNHVSHRKQKQDQNERDVVQTVRKAPGMVWS